MQSMIALKVALCRCFTMLKGVLEARTLHMQTTQTWRILLQTCHCNCIYQQPGSVRCTSCLSSHLYMASCHIASHSSLCRKHSGEELAVRSVIFQDSVHALPRIITGRVEQAGLALAPAPAQALTSAQTSVQLSPCVGCSRLVWCMAHNVPGGGLHLPAL